MPNSRYNGQIKETYNKKVYYPQKILCLGSCINKKVDGQVYKETESEIEKYAAI
ncbi:hypothetical protein GCM10009120_00490 [Sphingobacterium siyangense subsp. cladoniae]